MILRLLKLAAARVKPRELKRWLCRTALLLTILGLGGFLIAVSGLIPIKASSGHWAITRWFLNFSKERSIATHTLFVKTPVLTDPSLVVKGASHYETGCRPCHGSPGSAGPRIAQRMLPPPPDLAPVISKRETRELFYIIKHGIKLTGMPAWPSLDRDDEVWAMVAFLRRYPELDSEKYRQLARGETRARVEDLLPPERVPQAVSQSCARCHGWDGLGRGTGAFPKLAGQKSAYHLASLEAYARGQRHSGIMEPIAAGLSADNMRELALYYANLRGVGAERLAAGAPAEPTEAIKRGKAIANSGIPSQRVPACVACHGPSPTRHNPIYPLLAGQYADYLVLQLELFSTGRRGGTIYSHLMHFVAGQLTAEQRRDVALYYEFLPPSGGPSLPR